MPDRVTIPASLADEIAADLAAGGARAKCWQPTVEGPLLLLASDGGLAPGQVVHMQFDHGPVCLHVEGASVGVAVPGFWLRHAWAPVGGVDGGPRPDIGDRVHVLGPDEDPWTGEVLVSRVERDGDEFDGSALVRAADGYGSYATRWAILPPEVPAEVHTVADLDRTQVDRRPGTNTGHGHVWRRPDGVLARCGGPALCRQCREDAERWEQVWRERRPKAEEVHGD